MGAKGEFVSILMLARGGGQKHDRSKNYITGALQIIKKGVPLRWEREQNCLSDPDYIYNLLSISKHNSQYYTVYTTYKVYLK